MTPPALTVHFTVNKPLTPKRRTRVVENDEYAAFLRRVIDAYSRRVASGDIEAITAMAALASHLEDATRQAITGLREFGYSWADIAMRLGITRPAERPSGVNTPLTPKRQTRVIENDEYAAFLRRVIRAYSHRVAAGDIEAITTMAALADHLEDATRQAITGLRESGYSWADIAMRLGITRQGVQQRWGTTADGILPDGNCP